MSPSTRTQVHGHRGCAGPVPANTVPAFLLAAATGCHWLEMDVVITGDDHVLVSHEPWMDPRSCRGPQGRELTEGAGRSANIFRLPLAEVQRYGCVPADSSADTGTGSGWHKPTLAGVVRAVDADALERGVRPPSFNIEIKSEPLLYGTYQPPPARFAELVMAEVAALGITGRCIVQSFDPVVLEATHALAPQIPVALLVEHAQGLEADLRRLGFTPRYYSPAFSLVNAELVQALRSMGIGVLAWTVNREDDMLRMLGLGVDGLITDRPGTAMALLAARQ